MTRLLEHIVKHVKVNCEGGFRRCSLLCVNFSIVMKSMVGIVSSKLEHVNCHVHRVRWWR